MRSSIFTGLLVLAYAVNPEAIQPMLTAAVILSASFLGMDIVEFVFGKVVKK